MQVSLLPSGTHMDLHGWFNVCEAAFWIVLGGLFAVRLRSFPPELRRVAGVATVALVLFGVTDVIEVFTGAWYRPAALLMFNAACLLTLSGCYLQYRTIRQRAENEDRSSLLTEDSVQSRPEQKM